MEQVGLSGNCSVAVAGSGSEAGGRAAVAVVDVHSWNPSQVQFSPLFGQVEYTGDISASLPVVWVPLTSYCESFHLHSSAGFAV